MATAQPPQGFSYQAALRNANGEALHNQTVTLRIILTNEAGNTTFYSEEHTVVTNAQGVVSLSVGQGANILGSLSEILWGSEQVYVKIELQTEGGTFVNMGLSKIMSVPYAMFAADGNQGPQGEPGPQGSAGTDGRTVLNGTINPAYALGAMGDFYINTTSNQIFGPKTASGWGIGVSMIGAQGVDGRTILNGSTNPSFALGLVGDFYINTATSLLFGPKTSGGWGNGLSLIGPQGPIGSQGPQGIQGQQGIQGAQGVPGLQGNAGTDGISIQWLGTFGSNPASPSLNQAYYNSIDKKSYVYDGTSWQILSQDGQDAVSAVTGTGTIGKIALWSGESQLTSLESFNIDPNVAVISNPSAADNDPIFEVKNKDGKVVFGVYQSGVRIYVDESNSKAEKGGFAVGGLSTGKEEGNLYFRVTPDSVRVLLREPLAKAEKGGFAVGGLSTGKGTKELFFINPDSARIYIDNDPGKAEKGGFAVGGLSTGKSNEEYFRITRDSARISISNDGKAEKGGFAVGGLSTGKEKSANNYFNISTDASGIINPSEARVLWYPLKNAFLAGQVLITDPANVGLNSLAIGYETMAKGNRSQALGNKTKALGDYSTAIGDEAEANYANSFALGQKAIANAQFSYALGKEATASGAGSYAFGYMSVASGSGSIAMGINTTSSAASAIAMGGGTQASGIFSNALGYQSKSMAHYSTAMGYQSTSLGQYSTAIGYQDTARGASSLAIGYRTVAEGDHSVALGSQTKALQNTATAMGDRTVASGYASTALGIVTVASGGNSTAMGRVTLASGYMSTAMGAYTTASADVTTAMGNSTTASGNYSTAMGYETSASGVYSMASGANTTALSGYEIVTGRYNEEYTPASTFAWIDTDKLFVVGNGMSDGSRSNALTILKNGNLGLLTSNPSYNLSFGGNTNQTIGMERRTTDFGGLALTISSGGAFPGGTNKNGGNLVLSSGISTGTGTANIEFKTYTPSTTGSTDNTLSTKMTILGNGNVGIGTTTPSATLAVNGTVKIGASGTTITNIIKATVVQDILSISAGTSRTVTFTVSGAAVGSSVYISPASALDDGLLIAYARVSSANFIEAKFVNVTGSAIDPASMDFYITVIQ
jgi:hypothetical protein